MSDNATAIVLASLSLVGTIVTSALAAYGLWQNAQLKAQTSKLQDQGNDLHKQLNSITDARVASAQQAGHAEGMLAGAAGEQARVATKLAVADASAERIEEIRGGQQS